MRVTAGIRTWRHPDWSGFGWAAGEFVDFPREIVAPRQQRRALLAGGLFTRMP